MTKLPAFILALGCCLMAARPASANDMSSKNMLKTLCAAHSAEPVCRALAARDESLSEDQAWLILREACRTDATPLCTEFRLRQGGVLILDANTGRWTAEWEGAHWPLKFDVAGTPTLRLKPRDAGDLKILIDNISPLAYSALPGTPKEEDADVVANLRTFLSFAATGVQAIVQTSAFSPIATSAPAPGTSDETLRSSHGAGRGGRAGGGSPLPPSTPVAVDPFLSYISARNVLLLSLGQSMTDLSAQLDAIENSRTAFVAQAQSVEDGTAQAADFTGPGVPALNASVANFQRALAALTHDVQEAATCQPLLSTYALLLSAPADPGVVSSFVQQLHAVAGHPACRVPTLAGAVESETDSAGSAADQGSDAVDRWLKLHGAAMKPLVERLSKSKSTEADVWDAATKAAAAIPRVLSTVETLTRQVKAAQLHTWDHKLICALAVTRQRPDLPWDKIQTHTVVVKSISPYAQELTLAHAEGSHDFKLESATGQVLGYGVGVIYTPLHESTWTAVSAADGTKVIGETRRDTRAGDLAAFLVYRFMEHRPTPAPRRVAATFNFGAGLTSDHPAFFLGPGLEIARAVRLSAGWAPERVTTLVSGQTAGVTAVMTTDDIRTQQRFHVRNWYVSLSFALDALSLFNKP